LFIALAACARPDDTWERVRETGILRVGMDASFPPFEAITADQQRSGDGLRIAQHNGKGAALHRYSLLHLRPQRLPAGFGVVQREGEVVGSPSATGCPPSSLS